MAARLRRELGVEVEQVHGRYGEYTVLVDGDVVVDGGAKVIVGIMPSSTGIVEKVRERLGR